MSTEQKDELKSAGFFILEKWHIVTYIVGVLVILVSFYVTTQITLKDHSEKIQKNELKVEGLEKWTNEHQISDAKSQELRSTELYEIRYNLKNLCKKFNVGYIENK